MAQFGRPSADTNNPGSYTDQAGGGTTIYTTIDEVSYSDADYIRSPLAPASAVSPGPTDRWTTHSAAFTDYDRDGTLDLFVGFQYRRYGYLDSALQDRMYDGAADGTFTDVTDAAQLTTYVGTYDERTNHRPTDGTTACDVDGDGDDDLLASTYGRQFNMLWENLGDGTFRDVAEEVGFDGDDNLDYSDSEAYRC